jgi:hypothetical protein
MTRAERRAARRIIETSSTFEQGAIAALEGFRLELLADRGRIENEVEPAFDVIVDLLQRVVAELRASSLLDVVK